MAKVPAISIIVPVYKVELYIKQCIDSILNQTFQDFEIILVDDASPDNSFELCQKLYGGNDKFKFIRHEKNLGLGEARNNGIRYSTGKYVYFVDSDDFILPNTLETFYNAAEKTNAQVVHAAGWHELWQDEAEPVRQENLKTIWNQYNQEGFLPYDVVYRLEEHWKNYVTWSMAWLSFCRRDFLEQNKIEFLDIISEDETFNFALFCYAERYYILHDTLYVYRRRSGSIMMSNNLDKFSKSIRSIVVGSIYVKKLLEQTPKFNGCEQWREGIMNAFFNRFLVTHTASYYRDLDIDSAKDAVVEKTLAPFFTDGEPFVRFFFNGFNFYRRRSEILSQQNQQLNYITDLLIREQPAILELITAIKSGGRRIFLMGTPSHGNLGDQAIALSEFLLLKEYFPHYKIIEIPYMYLTDQLGEILWGLGFEKFLRKSDIIFLLGGGNLGNLWINEEQLRRKLIEKFPENKIVIFPQSIYFSADEDGRRELEISKKIYNGHKNLHLILRDENSLEVAQKIFPEVQRYLLPDTATALHGITDDIDVKREGVLFILRQDKERVRDDAKIQVLQDGFSKHNIPFEVTDTVINERVTVNNREQKVRDVLLKIRKSKLVITDRFHGIIFSFATRTPVLAFKSFDSKISSGIKWFKDLPSIFYAEEQDWVGIEDFVNKALFNEGTFAELNSSVKFDSKKVFFNTLNEIVRPNELEFINLFTPLPPVYLMGLTIALKRYLRFMCRFLFAIFVVITATWLNAPNLIKEFNQK